MLPRSMWPAIMAIGLSGSGCMRQPAMLSAPRIEGVAIADERVELVCDGERAQARCLARARYRLAPHETAEAFAVYSRRGQVASGLTPLAAAPAADPEVDPGLVHYRPARELSAYCGQLEPSTRSLEIDAQLAPPRGDGLRLTTPAPVGRHRSLARQLGYAPCAFDDRGCRFQIDYLTARQKDRAPGHEAEVTVDAPSGWQVEQQRLPPGAAREPLTQRRAKEPTDARIVTELYSGQSAFAAGGPVLGVGPRHADGRWVGAATLGWELFAPHWVAHGFMLDVDATGRVVSAFSSELVSPQLLILPSVGVGLGLPLELTPHFGAGGRVQLSAKFPYLAFVSTLDLFPGRAQPLVATLYLQLSL